MGMNLLPIVAIGTVAFFLTRKRRPKRRMITSNGNGDSKALPSSDIPASVFDASNPPDIITAKTGERFSIKFTEEPATGRAWSLAASPADNSVSHVETKAEGLATAAFGGTASRYYVFEGNRPGGGSLVFHHQMPWLKGKEPPERVIEIQTKIS